MSPPACKHDVVAQNVPGDGRIANKAGLPLKKESLGWKITEKLKKNGSLKNFH